MKNIRISFILLFFTVVFNSCLDMEDLRNNPNSAVSVSDPSLLLTTIIPRAISSFRSVYIKQQYHFLIGTDRVSTPLFNFSTFEGSFSHYTSLRNTNEMIKVASQKKTRESNAYKILGKFFRAYYYIEMTRRMGDVPLSEAEKGQKNPRPKYDTQKSIYIKTLNWLDEANTELGDFITKNPTIKIDGDFYFSGDLKKWQKIINAYTLRILISLSKRDADIDVKGRFTKIINTPIKYPLLGSLADNAQMSYKNEIGFLKNYNPNSQSIRGEAVYTSTYINILKSKEDPRLMKIADPTRKTLEANPKNKSVVKASFASYTGADISGDGSLNQTKRNKGEFSIPNTERFWNYIGQPGIWIGYWEQEFNIAEAAHRGWISVSLAKTHYENAIKASMKFYNVSDGKVTDYLKRQPYKTGDVGLTTLLEEKFIAFAENSGYESFFNVRRTGVPTYKFTKKYNRIDKYPIRWKYPSSENIKNKENYRQALKKQFDSEDDDVNRIIWLLNGGGFSKK